MNLHVVSFQVPYPPTYGGIIDVYYKLKALKEVGCHITLHTFRYRSDMSKKLKEVADTVYYYSRATGLGSMLSVKPYTVYSRRNPELLQRLLQDDDPILFEGLYTCLYLDHKALSARMKIVRAHNIEHDYYNHLAASSRNNIRRHIYYLIESAKLRRYERVLHHANAILAITPTDRDYFTATYPEADVKWVPCFHDDMPQATGNGTDAYILYHGNLSVEENIKAARFILSEVLPLLNGEYKVIFAGKNPSVGFKAEIAAHPEVELIANPDQATMDRLITRAHINLLPTFQDTGIKLKLINALHLGHGHCVVNTPMLTDSALSQLCTVGDTPQQIVSAIARLWTIEPTEADIKARTEYLTSTYNNAANARTITNLLQRRDRP